MSCFIPSYRRESNTEGPFPGEGDRHWTVHVVAWFGMEFALKVPREAHGYEAAVGVFGTPEYGRICDECVRRLSKGGVAC